MIQALPFFKVLFGSHDDDYNLNYTLDYYNSDYTLNYYNLGYIFIIIRSVLILLIDGFGNSIVSQEENSSFSFYSKIESVQELYSEERAWP